ncbi:hypothetical protein P4Q63_002198 [Salmonella enterica]|nr:hypothetical protein [Salmonella enterica]EKQ0890737.1 hypothetical protein [Salmonella enterica]
MQEQKRPILSIKRKPSLMYQKPPQKPDSEQNAAQPEQLADSDNTGTRKKPNYKEPPGWEEVKGKFACFYFHIGEMLTEMQLTQLTQKKKKSRRDNES